MQPGSVVGPYSIVGALGAGAMGEVYRARDRKLERDVAIKVLPAAFTADAERVSRFEREARALASLNHPHIAQIYGFEQAGSVNAIVLELVEGRTLADRLQPRGMPVPEALAIAAQIADALDAAHEKGIIHRDLKPANVKITPAGDVKVLDFGLAKTLSAVAAAAQADAPTVTIAPTADGVVMGTVPYMSPEQARGQSVDRRTDIWALGCVLYEMLTGRRPFRGATTSDVLAAILEREPDWSALPEATPQTIERLLRRCLDKDPRRRLRDAADARLEIEDALAAPDARVTASLAGSSSRNRALIIGAAGLAILFGAIALWMSTTRSEREAPTGPIRLTMTFPDYPSWCPVGCRRLAISEDGSQVAYAGTSRVYIRRMDQFEAVALEPGGPNPYFSPNGRWVGAGIHKIPIGGGPPAPIAGATDQSFGATWGADDSIVFATGDGLHAVSAGGGESRSLARPDRERGELRYAWPHFLPGDRSILFTIVRADPNAVKSIARMDIETLEREVLIDGGSDARYVATGHLVYASGSALMVVPFDAKSGRVRGDARAVPDIEVATATDNGAADFAVAANGTLVFRRPDEARDLPASGLRDNLLWIDREGNRELVPLDPGPYMHPRVSPDGRRVALDGVPGASRDIWIFDLDRSDLTQLTDGPTQDFYPIWNLDGTRVFFASDRDGSMDVYSQTADGATPPRLEFAAPGFQTPNALSPDGALLLINDGRDDTRVVTLGTRDRSEPLLQGPAVQQSPDFSSDGRWIVYESTESGSQFEIFVRPFPDVTASKKKISIDGGRYPLFSPDDREIYYLSLEGDMMAAAVTLSPTFEVGAVKKLFTWRKPYTGGVPYSVSPDGRFLVPEPAAKPPANPTHSVFVVQNWFTELERLAPAKP